MDINNPEKIIEIVTTHRHPDHNSGPHRQARQMHRVIPQVSRKAQHIESVYDPVIVSLGPYHHQGNAELLKSEDFKPNCVRWLARGSQEKMSIYYQNIMQNISRIRGSYAEASALAAYEDEELGLMILRDASFVVNYMANETRMPGNNLSEWRTELGMAAFPFILRDVVKLENQVPFFVLKLLIGLQDGDEGWDDLVNEFLVWLLLRDGSRERVEIPGEFEDPPLHLLEAVWRAMTQSADGESNVEANASRSFPFGSNLWQKLPKVKATKKKNEDVLYHSQRMFRSVMDLKAKGIYFSPSSPYLLRDVRFKSYSFKGELQLPVQYVSDQQQVILRNLIAYELSPETEEDYTVLSYTILMKSLIESPEDVKELQKRRILYNKYSNHEQVVRAFKDIDTYGIVNLDVFGGVKEKIGEHCRNKAKTWLADLRHNWLQTPWKVMAMFAAVFVLILTAVQAFYPMHR